ncbi:hypothetical protein PFFVO_04953 [Plasmodium falciparum Vietnam Oak-Knoll (FVO)]|uniref:Uncharacterized protein n=1 Tax=Plasmodium falciparum Vietnam Oak-Knoll (FVO) TaxID=1036723 RepID=A0A024UZV9_PLAFA|nr:hypothetical protein PFFVO_04953 [Plasmodium falciparum Vietnam Oak-Knoll (FVO)]
MNEKKKLDIIRNMLGELLGNKEDKNNKGNEKKDKLKKKYIEKSKKVLHFYRNYMNILDKEELDKFENFYNMVLNNSFDYSKKENIDIYMYCNIYPILKRTFESFVSYLSNLLEHKDDDNYKKIINNFDPILLFSQYIIRLTNDDDDDNDVNVVDVVDVDGFSLNEIDNNMKICMRNTHETETNYINYNMYSTIKKEEHYLQDGYYTNDEKYIKCTTMKNKDILGNNKIKNEIKDFYNTYDNLIEENKLKEQQKRKEIRKNIYEKKNILTHDEISLYENYYEENIKIKTSIRYRKKTNLNSTSYIDINNSNKWSNHFPNTFNISLDLKESIESVICQDGIINTENKIHIKSSDNIEMKELKNNNDNIGCKKFTNNSYIKKEDDVNVEEYKNNEKEDNFDNIIKLIESQENSYIEKRIYLLLNKWVKEENGRKFILHNKSKIEPLFNEYKKKNYIVTDRDIIPLLFFIDKKLHLNYSLVHPYNYNYFYYIFHLNSSFYCADTNSITFEEFWNFLVSNLPLNNYLYKEDILIGLEKYEKKKQLHKNYLFTVTFIKNFLLFILIDIFFMLSYIIKTHYYKCIFDYIYLEKNIHDVEKTDHYVKEDMKETYKDEEIKTKNKNNNNNNNDNSNNNDNNNDNNNNNNSNNNDNSNNSNNNDNFFLYITTSFSSFLSSSSSASFTSDISSTTTLTYKGVENNGDVKNNEHIIKESIQEKQDNNDAIFHHHQVFQKDTECACDENGIWNNTESKILNTNCQCEKNENNIKDIKKKDNINESNIKEDKKEEYFLSNQLNTFINFLLLLWGINISFDHINHEEFLITEDLSTDTDDNFINVDTNYSTNKFTTTTTTNYNNSNNYKDDDEKLKCINQTNKNVKCKKEDIRNNYSPYDTNDEDKEEKITNTWKMKTQNLYKKNYQSESNMNISIKKYRKNTQKKNKNEERTKSLIIINRKGNNEKKKNKNKINNNNNNYNKINKNLLYHNTDQQNINTFDDNQNYVKNQEYLNDENGIHDYKAYYEFKEMYQQKNYEHIINNFIHSIVKQLKPYKKNYYNKIIKIIKNNKLQNVFINIFRKQTSYLQNKNVQTYKKLEELPKCDENKIKNNINENSVNNNYNNDNMAHINNYNDNNINNYLQDQKIKRSRNSSCNKQTHMNCVQENYMTQNSSFDILSTEKSISYIIYFTETYIKKKTKKKVQDKKISSINILKNEQKKNTFIDSILTLCNFKLYKKKFLNKFNSENIYILLFFVYYVNKQIDDLLTYNILPKKKKKKKKNK